MDKSKWKNDWSRILIAAVAGFRTKNPNDKRSNEELYQSFLDHLERVGIVRRDPNTGKQLLPHVEDADEFIRKLVNELN